MNSRYYTASEAQARLKLSKAMFFRKVSQGLIPKVVLPGMKQGIYPRRDIDALALSMDMVFEQFDKLSFSKATLADQVEAMNIGIRCFGRDFITTLPERIIFQQKSEFTFHALKTNDHVVGYISSFRFPEKLLDDLLTGRKIEREITSRDVLPFVRLEPFNVYIDVIAVDPDLSLHLRRLYAGIMVVRFVDTLLNLLANGYQINRVYTVATSREGDNLTRKLGFQCLEGKTIAPGRIAYTYSLDPEGIERLRTLRNRRGL